MWVDRVCGWESGVGGMGHVGGRVCGWEWHSGIKMMTWGQEDGLGTGYTP